MTPQQSLANMLGKARAIEVEAGAHKRRFQSEMQNKFGIDL